MALNIKSAAQRILAEHRAIKPTGHRPVLKREELNEQIKAFLASGKEIDCRPSVEIPHKLMPVGAPAEGIGA